MPPLTSGIELAAARSEEAAAPVDHARQRRDAFGRTAAAAAYFGEPFDDGVVVVKLLRKAALSSGRQRAVVPVRDR